MFTLFICSSYFLGVCTNITTFDYPTETACYKAAQFVLDNSNPKPALVTCVPKGSVHL